ncbi:hypothetical protein PRZ48_004089 [Zasmidium cellare]|uniref:Uncharacterized protein n=1 Tax=Zasmidium cellare TaxID=395010 RepID=A0ABR0EWW2_ZASCE|nr:hypothetical protein PRZ48_004089 [Zasmidium cellare]
MTYSKPNETKKVFENDILSNPLIAPSLPAKIRDAASHVHFTGDDSPSLPVNWRFAEAVSALKGLEASLVNVILDKKYHTAMRDVTINTDKASMFIFSVMLWTIDPDGENMAPIRLQEVGEAFTRYFPSQNLYKTGSSLYRSLVTGIYKCADGRYFNMHASLNPDPTLESIGLPHDMEVSDLEEGVKVISEATGKVDSKDIQRLNSEVYRQAGTICYSVEEFRESEHGKANAHVGLWEIYDQPTPTQPASWWPDSPQTSPSRPLAGLKVVDLTRILAAPAMTRGLAELGASVMRCTSPNLPDQNITHADLNWGKWNCSIDLHKEEDREKLKALIIDADVVVQDYRPGALDKYGFSQQNIIDMCSGRERGIIYVRENCYGWHGPWKDRSGWQQISDACVGLSMGFGRAMGHGEPVTPIFPHSDYCTGISGTCAILIALLRRGEQGGSYCVDLALNYYSSWLANSVGEYPKDVFERVWKEECGGQVFRHWHPNHSTVPAAMEQLRKGPAKERLFKPEFFEDRSAPVALGDDKKKIRCLAPIAEWDGTVKLGFNVGARGNGTDAARWPNDLTVERVI